MEIRKKNIRVRLLMALSFVFAAISLQAQNLTVKVTLDNHEPIRFAYIYLNNKIITTTDSIGIALISMDKIHSGDTVTARFLGYGTSSACISREIMQKSECNIDLIRNYAINQIDVTANPEALYKKYAAISPFYHYASRNNLNYTYDLKKDGRVIKSGDGNLALVYLYKQSKEPRQMIEGAYCYPDANVNDETDFDRQLMASVHHYTNSTAPYYNVILRGTKSLRYVGVRDNCHVFSAIGRRYNSKTQIICFFDKETNLLSHVGLSMVGYDDQGNIVITKESEFSVARKRVNFMANEYYITDLKQVVRYKDMELTTRMDVDNQHWKFDKRIPWSVVPNVRSLLDSDFSDREYADSRSVTSGAPANR